MHFYITKYRDDSDGKYYAESWMQINLFGKHFCLLKRKIEIYPKPNDGYSKPIPISNPHYKGIDPFFKENPWR